MRLHHRLYAKEAADNFTEYVHSSMASEGNELLQQLEKNYKHKINRDRLISILAATIGKLETCVVDLRDRVKKLEQ